MTVRISVQGLTEVISTYSQPIAALAGISHILNCHRQLIITLAHVMPCEFSCHIDQH